ncbi:hypothetical protein MMC10_010619 [Thelotrema lepadinum]|nr:hypothetical protein [Thelotrema lepadinum]
MNYQMKMRGRSVDGMSQGNHFCPALTTTHSNRLNSLPTPIDRYLSYSLESSLLKRIATTAERTEKFRQESSIPIPYLPITPQDRIDVLKRALDPEDSIYLPHQKSNIEALISMYERGEVHVDQKLWVMEGRLVTEEEYLKPRAPYFHEVCAKRF